MKFNEERSLFCPKHFNPTVFSKDFQNIALNKFPKCYVKLKVNK